jgi:hypothetical protein
MLDDILMLMFVQFKGWKDILPIETIDRLLRVLFPQIEKLCVDKFASACVSACLT